MSLLCIFGIRLFSKNPNELAHWANVFQYRSIPEIEQAYVTRRYVYIHNMAFCVPYTLDTPYRWITRQFVYTLGYVNVVNSHLVIGPSHVTFTATVFKSPDEMIPPELWYSRMLIHTLSAPPTESQESGRTIQAADKFPKLTHWLKVWFVRTADFT